MPLAYKQQQIMGFLNEQIFNPILVSPNASEGLKQGVRYTIMRLEQRDAAGMVHFFGRQSSALNVVSVLRLR